MPHGAIGLCAQQPERASWVAPMIAEQFPGAPSLAEDGVVWALLPARRGDDPARATAAAAQGGGRHAERIAEVAPEPRGAWEPDQT